MNKQDIKSQFNTKNERIKYKYRQHLRCIGQKDNKTIIAALKHLRDYEIAQSFTGFEAFNDQIADKYIQMLFRQKLSLSYIDNNIRHVREFLNWLERQRGYRSKINYNHIEYLNISQNQRRTAKAKEYQRSYTYEQIIKTIRQMPDSTDKEKRDKAMVSLQALCSLRISELRMVKIKSLIEENGRHFIYVCPRDMEVKFSKTRQAVFITLPDDILQNVLTWRDALLSMGFKEPDPLFPVIDNRFNQTNLLAQSIKKEGIKSNTTIRNVFKKAFESAGYPYIRPHSFRHSMARYAQNQSPAFLNAVRQSLGHSSIDTTLNSYGQLSLNDQCKVMQETRIK